MEFLPKSLYHIYSRGNNQQQIFFSKSNYLFFLDKVKKYIIPHSDLLCYCLMPNHFHFLVCTNELVDTAAFSNSIRIMLSSYSRAINIQVERTGSLFQQNCKAKEIALFDQQINSYNYSDYLLVCFNYIHQNPIKAGLVSSLEDWEFSSYKDYIGLRYDTLCNQPLAFDLIDFGINIHDLPATLRHKLIRDITLKTIDPEKLKFIF